MNRRKWRVLGGFLLLVVTIGAIVEEIGRGRDRRHYSQVGTSYDVGGRRLNLFCSGKGSPTVVFGTFAHQAGYGWAGVQPEVARFTRACWYDRAGYGWSDPGPLYRTAADVVEDLRALLRAADERPPYVIVGNGDVTLQARIFRNRYQNDLVGAVFVGGNELEDSLFVPEAGQSKFQQLFGASLLPAALWTVCQVMPAYARIGLLRLFGGRPRGTNHFGLSPEQEDMHAFLSDNPTASRYTHTAQCRQQESRAQARLAGNLGNIPVIVLTSEPVHRVAAISSRGRVKIMSGSRRAGIVEAIREIVDDIQPRPGAN